MYLCRGCTGGRAALNVYCSQCAHALPLRGHGLRTTGDVVAGFCTDKRHGSHVAIGSGAAFELARLPQTNVC